MEQETHIAGVVVYAQRAAVALIKSRISALPVAEVHAATDDGKLVVTLETDSAKRTVDYMDAIQALPGVLNVALVYQHAEPLSEIEQVIQP